MTYLEARTLLEQRMAALGKRPWFWRRRARKLWADQAQAAMVQFVRDTMVVFGDDLADALGRARREWGVAKVVDSGDVN